MLWRYGCISRGISEADREEKELEDGKENCRQRLRTVRAVAVGEAIWTRVAGGFEEL